MKIGDLVQLLQEHDQDADIVLSSESEPGRLRLFFAGLRRRYRWFMVRFKSDEKVINGAYRFFGIDKTYKDLIAEGDAYRAREEGYA